MTGGIRVLAFLGLLAICAQEGSAQSPLNRIKKGIDKAKQQVDSVTQSGQVPQTGSDQGPGSAPVAGTGGQLLPPPPPGEGYFICTQYRTATSRVQTPVLYRTDFFLARGSESNDILKQWQSLPENVARTKSGEFQSECHDDFRVSGPKPYPPSQRYYQLEQPFLGNHGEVHVVDWKYTSSTPTSAGPSQNSQQMASNGNAFMFCFSGGINNTMYYSDIFPLTIQMRRQGGAAQQEHIGHAFYAYLVDKGLTAPNISGGRSVKFAPLSRTQKLTSSSASPTRMTAKSRRTGREPLLLCRPQGLIRMPSGSCIANRDGVTRLTRSTSREFSLLRFR